MFYVYVIENIFTNRRYIGQSCDINRRLAEHNNPYHNQQKYTTKHSGPWKLVYYEKYVSRSEAMKRERWLKSGTGRQWLIAEIGRASPPGAD